MTEAAPVRGEYWLSHKVRAALERAYAIRSVALGLAGIDAVAYWVRRPWGEKLLLGPFNAVPDYGALTADVVAAAAALARDRSRRATGMFRVAGARPAAVADDVRWGIDSTETVLPLAGGMDAVLAGMRPRSRTKLRKSTRDAAVEGISVAAFTDKPTLRAFHAMLSRLYLRRHRMIPPPWPLFDLLFDASDGAGRATGYAIRRGEDLIGGMIVLGDRHQWMYAWGGTRIGTSQLDLTGLLLQQAIADAVAAGARWFSLGMTPQSMGSLLQYKRGWGGYERPYGYATFRAELPNLDPSSSYPIVRSIASAMPGALVRALAPLAFRVAV